MTNTVAQVYTDFSGLKELSAQARTEPNAAAVEVARVDDEIDARCDSSGQSVQ